MKAVFGILNSSKKERKMENKYPENFEIYWPLVSDENPVDFGITRCLMPPCITLLVWDMKKVQPEI